MGKTTAQYLVLEFAAKEKGGFPYDRSFFSTTETINDAGWEKKGEPEQIVLNTFGPQRNVTGNDLFQAYVTLDGIRWVSLSPWSQER